MAYLLQEATTNIATATLITTPTHSNGLLAVFPLEVWEMIIPHVPETALGRLAVSARFFRKLLDDERHWQRRLALHGLLELFTSHPARNCFPTWKEYFAAQYLASRKPYHPPPLPFVSEYEASLDAAPRVPMFCNAELLDQFSDVQPSQVKEILFMQASEPYYPRYHYRNPWESSRAAHPGHEHGIFILVSGELHATYRLHPTGENSPRATLLSASARTLRELKSTYALHSVPCPVPFSYLDWHSHMLDCIRLAVDSNSLHWTTHTVSEHYFFIIARRRPPPQITVHYKLTSARFQVLHLNPDVLLDKIVRHFAVGNELHRVSHKQLHLQNDLGVVFPSDTTQRLIDGQVWLLRPDTASKRNSLGLQMT